MPSPSAKSDQNIKMLSIDEDIDDKNENTFDSHNHTNNSKASQVTPIEPRKQNEDDFLNPLEFLDAKLNSSKDECEDIHSSPANTRRSRNPDPDYTEDHDSDSDSDSPSPQDFRLRLRKRNNGSKVLTAKDTSRTSGAKQKEQETNQNRAKRKSKTVKQAQTKKLTESMSKTKKERKKRIISKNPSTTLITTCSTCNISFGERQELLNHNSELHTETVFCNVCFREFKSEYTLKAHLRTHGIGENLTQCDLCSDKKFFRSKFQLNEHQESFHGMPKSFHCQLCSKGFSRKKELDIHIASKHIGLRVVCSEAGCDRDFTTTGSMKTHVRKDHLKKFAYFCPVESCNKGFIHLSSRELHYSRFHLKIKPFKCSECDKDFISNCDLKQHKIQNHSRSHKFRCSTCKKVFATEKYLTRHALEVHSVGESGYICTKCPKKLANSSRLKNHYLNKHADHSERPFKCSICNNRFVAKSQLKVHDRKLHKK